VIVFHPLGREEIREIVDLQLKKLNDQLEKNGYKLEVSDEAKTSAGERRIRSSLWGSSVEASDPAASAECSGQRIAGGQLHGGRYHHDRCCSGRVCVF
jgi:hypothetical protein